MRKNRFSSSFVLLVSLSLLISCRSGRLSLPAFLQEQTPTHTPTLTLTPLPPSPTLISTSTPALSITPTADETSSVTPTPAVKMTPCAFPEDCPGVREIMEYISDQVGSGNTYNVNIPYDQPLSIRAVWVIYEPGVVKVDLDVLRFFFEIDGQDYARREDVLVSVVPDSPGSSRYNLAAGIGYVLQGFKAGEPHTVHIGYEFLEKVTDAGFVFEPGSMFHYTYIINPVSASAAAPGSTPSPKPTAVSPTPVGACEPGTSISVINDTGGQVTLYFTGTAKYSFNIAPGSQTLNLCSGEYSYTAYGCGGASLSGSAGDGDEIKFWCE